MKKISFKMLMAIVLSSVTFFQSCKKDEVISTKEGQVLLSFSVANSQLKKAIIDSESSESSNLTEDPAAIVVSISNEKGVSLYSNERMNLLKFGEDYVTKTLTLKPGNYVITEYYVVDKLNNVIYSAPQSGSVVAKWVNEPLPINFDVKKDAVTKLAPEVVSTLNASPEDFGYTTFRLNALNTFDFLISVFAYDTESKSFDLVSSKLKVSAKDKEILSKELDANTNLVNLPDNYEEYVVTVDRDGFKTFIDTVSISELKKYFSSDEYGPYKVYLEEGEGEGEVVTLITNQTDLKKVTVDARVHHFNSSPAKEILVDWGDGSDIESLNVGGLKNSHLYSKSGVYVIKLIGGVKDLSALLVDDSNIESVDLSLASKLEVVSLKNNKLLNIDLSSFSKIQRLYVNGNKLSEINLDNNQLLESLDIKGNQLKNIDLSNNSKLNFLSLVSNPISSINVSNLQDLEILWIGKSNISHIDLTKNLKLKIFSFQPLSTKLVSLDVTNNTELETLSLYGQRNLNEIDLKNNKKLKHLNINHTSIKNVDISNNIELLSIGVGGCQLQSMDIKNNGKLKHINLLSNNLDLDYINEFYLALLSNVRNNNVKNGTLYIDQLEPSSPKSIQAKKDLVDIYGWAIKNSF